MATTEVKDTDSDSIAGDQVKSNHQSGEADFAMETEDQHTLTEGDTQAPEEEEEMANAETSLQSDSNGHSIQRTLRTSRASKVKPKTAAKTPEKRGQKRKSTTETPSKSKIPKHDPVPVTLNTKTITVDDSFLVVDRGQLTIIPPKEGAYEVGDLIWSKMTGYPWWPCIISIDPKTGIYSKISGASYKADRVYHVQYFGPEASRGWTNIGMVMPFEGYENFYDRICEEIEDQPKPKVTKILEKFDVKKGIKKKWDQSISEAELAMKLDKRERVRKLTFNYILDDGGISTPKSRKSAISSVTSSPVVSMSLNSSIVSSSTPNNGKSAKKASSQKSSKGKKSGKKAATESGGDVYEFDEDSDTAEQPFIGLKLNLNRNRAPKGEFQVYFRKHFDEEAKRHPNRSKAEIDDFLRQQWKELEEDERAIYVARKALYEPESNMLVAKRSNFDDDFSNDSDYDYNDSEGGKDLDGNDISKLSNSNNNSTSKAKRSKSRKSEKLFDKIKNEDKPIRNGSPSTSSEHPSNGSKQRSSKVSITPALPKETTSSKSLPSTAPEPIPNSGSTSKKVTELIRTEQLNSAKKKVTTLSDRPSKKKILYIGGDSTDDTSSDTTSVNSEILEKPKKGLVDQFCFECSNEEIPGNGLVSCEGVCKRIFHSKCKELIDNLCDECRNNQHICFACQNPDDFDTKKCEDSKCGRFYHLNCIENHYPIKVNETANSFLCPLHTCLTCHFETLNDKEYRSNKRKLYRCIRCPSAYHSDKFCSAAGSLKVSSNYIICPVHQEIDKGSKKRHDRHINVNYCFACLSGGNLICCELCPAAFHEDCLEYTFDHDKNFYCSSCTQRKQLLYNEIVWVKLGSYRWWPAKIVHPDNLPEKILNLSHNPGDFPVYFFGSHDYYWVNKGRAYHFVEGDQQGKATGSNKALKNSFNAALEEAKVAFAKWKDERKQIIARNIAKQPPPYHHISHNRYLVPKINGNGEKEENLCECKKNGSLCQDDQCLNRVSYIECDPKRCPVNDQCKNQRFRKLEYAKLKPFKTENAGWGLMAEEDLKEGQFVIEYCGEVIDEQECDRRLKKIASDQSNFYFLNLDKDLFIDAGPKGNLSRFMNHSCEPNCITQKWEVNKMPRVGLFALKDIPAGTELTFNYNLDCRGNERTKCECGSPQCMGFIGGPNKRPMKKEKTEIAQAKRLTNGKKARNGKVKNSKKAPSTSDDLHEDVCFKCGERGNLMMCDQEGCLKSYHAACLSYEKVPEGTWVCPRHECMKDACHEPASTLCSVCPNSLCKEHAPELNSLHLPDNQWLCEAHRFVDDCPDELSESELKETVAESSADL